MDGSEIETQEIYGVESSSDPECVICMTAPKDTACLPCRHMCMCSGCAIIHNMHADTCPICRTKVESMLRINAETPNAAADAPAPAPEFSTAGGGADSTAAASAGFSTEIGGGGGGGGMSQV